VVRTYVAQPLASDFSFLSPEVGEAPLEGRKGGREGGGKEGRKEGRKGGREGGREGRTYVPQPLARDLGLLSP